MLSGMALSKSLNDFEFVKVRVLEYLKKSKDEVKRLNESAEKLEREYSLGDHAKKGVIKTLR